MGGGWGGAHQHGKPRSGVKGIGRASTGNRPRSGVQAFVLSLGSVRMAGEGRDRGGREGGGEGSGREVWGREKERRVGQRRKRGGTPSPRPHPLPVPILRRRRRAAASRCDACATSRNVLCRSATLEDSNILSCRMQYPMLIAISYVVAGATGLCRSATLVPMRAARAAAVVGSIRQAKRGLHGCGDAHNRTTIHHNHHNQRAI